MHEPNTKAAVAWLESQPIGYYDGIRSYADAGDDRPVVPYYLASFKDDHEAEYMERCPYCYSGGEDPIVVG